MKNKVLVCCAAGLTIILGAFFAVICKGGGTTFAAVFKTCPYDRGYSYKGSGTALAAIDEKGIETISGFPRGEAGQVFMNMLKEDIAFMNMKIELEGQGKGGSASTMFKLTGADGVEYESRYYTDGTKKWFYTSVGGREGKWTEAVPCSNIENVASSVEVEGLERIKDSIVLRSQGEDSSTFHVDITGQNAELFFGDEGKRFFKSFGEDFSEVINEMELSIDIETSDRVDVFTEYAKISNVRVSFALPYNKTGALANDRIKELGPEEKKIFHSMYMKVNFSMDFTYEEVEVRKPATA